MGNFEKGDVEEVVKGRLQVNKGTCCCGIKVAHLAVGPSLQSLCLLSAACCTHCKPFLLGFGHMNIFVGPFSGSKKCLVVVQENRGRGSQGDFDKVQICADLFTEWLPSDKLFSLTPFPVPLILT